MHFYMGTKKILIFNTAQLVDIIGGSQSALEDAIDTFLELNYEVIYISYKYNNIQNYSSPNFKRIFVTKLRLNPLKFVLDSIFVFYYIIFKKYDIVWANSAMPSFIYIPFVKSNYKLYTFHGPVIEEQLLSNKCNLKIFLTKYAYKFFLKYFDKLHFNTNYVKTAVESEYLFTKYYQSFVYELLLNEKKYIFNINRITQNILNTNFINVLIPRRLVKRTGVLHFVKSLKKLDKKLLERYKFYITGEGDEKNEIIECIKDLKLSSINIEFLGLINKNNMLSFLKSVDVVCIPSIGAEGFCLPAKEGLLSNKFVLHSGQGGLNETLHNYTKSIQYNTNDINTLEQALKYILKYRNSFFIDKISNNYITNFKLIFNEE
jgi:hypothetical protein